MVDAPLQGCRLACSAVIGVYDSAKVMAANLGSSWAFDVDMSTTHLLVTSMDDAFAVMTQRLCPWVHVVHVHWLCRCYRKRQRADEKSYDPTFYTSARRTGTRTIFGSKETFFSEVGHFHAVESLLPSYLDEPLRHILLGSLGYDPREHFIWPAACRYLQDTVFWGHLVRERNWHARRTLIMSLELKKPGKMPRKRPRDCQDGPAHVLTRVAQLPKELRRIIVGFV